MNCEELYPLRLVNSSRCIRIKLKVMALQVTSRFITKTFAGHIQFENPPHIRVSAPVASYEVGMLDSGIISGTT